MRKPFYKNPDGGDTMPMLDPREVPAFESGGGGLMSTALDYARFLQFMLNRGFLGDVRLLSSRTVDFMTSDHLGDIGVHAASAPADLLPAGNGFGLALRCAQPPAWRRCRARSDRITGAVSAAHVLCRPERRSVRVDDDPGTKPA